MPFLGPNPPINASLFCLIISRTTNQVFQCPYCKGPMKPGRTFIRRERITFFQGPHGLLERLVPPSPPLGGRSAEKPPFSSFGRA